MTTNRRQNLYSSYYKHKQQNTQLKWILLLFLLYSTFICTKEGCVHCSCNYYSIITMSSITSWLEIGDLYEWYLVHLYNSALCGTCANELCTFLMSCYQGSFVLEQLTIFIACNLDSWRCWSHTQNGWLSKSGPYTPTLKKQALLDYITCLTQKHYF